MQHGGDFFSAVRSDKWCRQMRPAGPRPSALENEPSSSGENVVSRTATGSLPGAAALSSQASSTPRKLPADRFLAGGEPSWPGGP